MAREIGCSVSAAVGAKGYPVDQVLAKVEADVDPLLEGAGQVLSQVRNREEGRQK